MGYLKPKRGLVRRRPRGARPIPARTQFGIVYQACFDALELRAMQLRRVVTSLDALGPETESFEEASGVSAQAMLHCDLARQALIAVIEDERMIQRNQKTGGKDHPC